MLCHTCGILVASIFLGIVSSVTGTTTIHTKIICEYKTGTVSCPSNYGQIINITYANYGRLSTTVCPTSSQLTNCRSNVSLVAVRQLCYGLNSCTLNASNSVFGDPCVSVLKYLIVKYTCMSADSFPSLPSLGNSYVFENQGPSTYITTITQDSGLFLESPYYYSLFRITQVQLAVQGNPFIYNKALSFLISSLSPPSRVSGACMPSIHDLSSQFCLYRNYGYIYAAQTFVPGLNMNKSYELSVLIRDSSEVPVVRRANLTVSVVPKCFPMTELYESVRRNCGHSPIVLTYPAGLPWSGSLYGSKIPIAVVSSLTIIAKIFIDVDLLAHYYEGSFTYVKYNITFTLKNREYQRTFYYSGTPQYGLPLASGNKLNITLYPPIEVKNTDEYVNVSLKLVYPRVRTNIVFNSENAVKLYGSKKISDCPGSLCLSAYQTWARGVDKLRFTSLDSCIQDDFFQEVYLQPCGSELKYGNGQIPHAAPGQTIVYSIKSQIDFGSLNPTFFKVINYAAEDVFYPGYSMEYYCAEKTFSDNRKFICLNRHKGLLRVRSSSGNGFALLPINYKFTLEIQAEATVDGIKYYRICVIDLVITASGTLSTTVRATTLRVSATFIPTATATATTVPATTTPAPTATVSTTAVSSARASAFRTSSTPSVPTTTIAPTTKIMPIAEFCVLAQKCRQQYEILSTEKQSSKTKLIYGLESVLSSVRFKLWSVDLQVRVLYPRLRIELFCVSGLRSTPITNISAELTNNTNSLILDVEVPKTCDSIALSMFNVSNNVPKEFTSSDVVTLSLATFHSCDDNQCVELYKLWNILHNGSFCPGKPFVRYSICFESILLVVPTTALFFQPLKLSCQGFQASKTKWYKDNSILQSHAAVLSLSGTVYDDQGYYMCSVQRQGKEVSSKEILFKYKDVYTSTVYLEIVNRKYTADLGDQTSEGFKQLSSQLVKSVSRILTSLLTKRAHDITVAKFSGASTVLATLKIYSNILDQTSMVTFYAQMKNLLKTAATGNDFDPLRISSETIIVLNHEYCLPETTNQERSKGPYKWPITGYQSAASVKCSNGPTGMVATRVCAGNFTIGAFWQSVRDTNCDYNSKTTKKLDDLSKVVVNASNAVEVTAELEKLTKNASTFSSDDTLFASETFSNIVALNITSDKIVDDLLMTASNLLKVDEAALSSSQSQGKALSNIVKGIETLADIIPLPNKTGQPVVKVSSGVAIQAVQIDSTYEGPAAFALKKPNFDSQNVISNQEYRATDVAVGISLPDTITSDVKTKGPSRLSFVAYNGGQFFQSSRKDAFGQRVRDATTSPNSMVISAHVKGENRVNLSRPLNGTFKKTNKSLANKCVFWDFNLNDGYGAWSSDGCRELIDKDNRVVCQCDHMTNFAILFDVYAGSQQSTDPQHETILGIISFVGIGLSLGGLGITLITLMLFRRLRRNLPSKILIHLCLSLMLTLICFVIGADMTEPVYACRGFAIAIQYFLLVCFSWMVVEAVNLYLSFVIVMGTYISRFMIKAGICAWGLPIIIVAFTAWQRFEEYGNDRYCVVTGWAAYGTLFAPICLAILINFIAFGMVFHALRNSAKGKKITKDQRRTGMSQLRIAAAFSCILGLTWVFGLFAIADARIVFQYLFCIFNSLQGFTIFYLHVARQKEARSHWIHFLTGNGLNYYRSSLVSTSRAKTMKPPSSADKRERITSTDSANTLTSTLKSNRSDSMKLSSINKRLDSSTSTASET